MSKGLVNSAPFQRLEAGTLVAAPHRKVSITKLKTHRIFLLFTLKLLYGSGSDAQDAETGRQRSRAMSMEEYDIPNVRRLSLAKRD